MTTSKRKIRLKRQNHVENQKQKATSVCMGPITRNVLKNKNQNPQLFSGCNMMYYSKVVTDS